MKHLFPLSFIQQARYYAEEHRISLKTACIVAGTNDKGLHVFSWKHDVMRWAIPSMRNLVIDGGVFVDHEHAREMLTMLIKEHPQDMKTYPDAQIHLVKNLRNK